GGRVAAPGRVRCSVATGIGGDAMTREMPTLPVRRITPGDFETLIDREWLVTNGLGGYASGTLAGVNTRRSHGFLTAAPPPPLGRVMALNHLTDNYRFPDWSAVSVGGNDRSPPAPIEMYGSNALAEFRLEAGLPVWLYEFPGYV